MPWNGSGSFTRSNGVTSGSAVWATEAATTKTISSANQDYHDNDVASGIQACLAKNGENGPSADLPMATYKHTGVGNAGARNQYAAAGQVQDGAFIWCGTSGGSANAQTLTPTPAITAYAAGQVFRFKVGYTNTDATTIAVSGLTAKNVRHLRGAPFCSGGELVANDYAEILYNGTDFTMLTCTRDYPLIPILAAGSTIADAEALYGYKHLATVICAGSGRGVKLPTIGSGCAIGTEISVFNVGDFALTIYPDAAEYIADGGAGVPLALPLRDMVKFVAIAADRWAYIATA